MFSNVPINELKATTVGKNTFHKKIETFLTVGFGLSSVCSEVRMDNDLYLPEKCSLWLLSINGFRAPPTCDMVFFVNE